MNTSSRTHQPSRYASDGGRRHRDNFNARDGMHDWVLASENMAKALAAKAYHYQFVFARDAGHTDRTVKQANPA